MLVAVPDRKRKCGWVAAYEEEGGDVGGRGEGEWGAYRAGWRVKVGENSAVHGHRDMLRAVAVGRARTGLPILATRRPPTSWLCRRPSPTSTYFVYTINFAVVIMA